MIVDKHHLIMSSRNSLNHKLLIAAEDGDLGLVKSLIEQGANVNCQDKHGYCAVLRAVHDDNPDCMQLLFDNGANPDLKNEDGYTALWWSVFFRHENCLKTLIQNGANLDVEDNAGQTALHLACQIGYLEGVKLLAEHNAKFTIPDIDGNYPSDLARISNNHRIISYINSYHDDKVLDQSINWDDEVNSESLIF